MNNTNNTSNNLSYFDSKINNKITIVSDKNKNRYNDAKCEFKTYFEKGINLLEEAKKRINIMVTILHEEYPDWSIRKIAYQIWLENEDIEGFSKDKIYRNLDEANILLLNPTKQNRKKVLGESVLTNKHKILEESSTTNTDADADKDYKSNLPTIYQTKHAENIKIKEEKANGNIKDLPNSTKEYFLSNKTLQENNPYLTQYQELQTTKQLLDEARIQIEEQDQKIKELSIEKVGTYVNRFTFTFDLEVKDQEIPLLITVFPHNRSGYVMIDEKKAKQLRRF